MRVYTYYVLCTKSSVRDGNICIACYITRYHISPVFCIKSDIFAVPCGTSRIFCRCFANVLLYRPKPIHCNYQLAHYSGFRRISPSILNRFKPNLQAQQCAKKHVSVNFLSFLPQAVSEHGAAATFFQGVPVTVQGIPRLPHTTIIRLN